MSSRIPRAAYWLFAAAAITLVAGLTVGALTLGSFSFTPHQAGAAGVPPSPPDGVSFPLAEASLVAASTNPAVGACNKTNLGTEAKPTNLTSGVNATLCLSSSTNGFALGDAVYLIEISWNASAPLSTEFEIQVYFGTTPTVNSVSVTSYILTTATITAYEGAVYVLDLTQAGDTSVTGFSVLVTQL